MKTRTILNTLVIALIVLIGYFFIGHDFVEFYAGGKVEMLDTATGINKQCNAKGSCPTTLEGWQARRKGMLFKGNMLYLVTPLKTSKGSAKGKYQQSFKLVYRFFMPDDWFEAQGGVGKKVTSGWKSR